MDLNIFKNFLPNEDVVAYSRFKNGHINRTFLVITENKNKYIFQRINQIAFKDVDLLMNNIKIVTEHLKSKNVESIQMLTASDGKNYIKVDDSYYRMYKLITNAFTYEKPEGLETVKYAAKAFGKFHNYLSDLDANKLGYTIPYFHDTPKRYENLLLAYKNDKAGRSTTVDYEMNCIKKYADKLSLIVDGINSGEVKLHITHNDPKINNALFDEDTRKYRAVIDLDTTMPGSVLYDFGDALRSLFTGDNEDSKDYKQVVGNTDIYSEYLKAYYKETSGFLTKREKELFPYAPFILSIELAIRFLEDYLNGDVYFSTRYPNHNLDRSRTQLNLATSIIENIDEYIKITNEIVGE